MLFTEYNEDLVRKIDRQEAREEGRDEINALNCKLLELDRMDDLIKSSQDKDYQRKLLYEFFPDAFPNLKTE